ncbi:MAG TPA: hypothetical protein VGP72_19365 [Planctomycetota bacterium]
MDFEPSWDMVDVDWELYHPRARELLNHPIFWTMTHDSAPHGNDTGADVLGIFQKHRESFRDVPVTDFVDELLIAWKVKPLDWDECRSEAVEKMLALKRLQVSICDDTILAAVFAAVKFFGRCDSDSIQTALIAIEREKLPCVLKSRGWWDNEKRCNHLDLYEKCLGKLFDQNAVR